MAETIAIGDPVIEVRVRRNARARRMVLRVSHVANAPVLTLPPGASLRGARAFVRDHEDWLRRHLASSPARDPVRPGGRLPFRGGELVIERRAAGRTAIEDGRLLVAGPEAAVPARAAAFLRELARQRLAEAAARHAARLGRAAGRISLRDPRGRWGSCNAAGDLMFSWRLILAPDAVLDYVAAHEVAHLEEMSHAPRFWAVVERLRPDWRDQRAWLRRNGAALMALDFAPAP
jgi:hypothetical protein